MTEDAEDDLLPQGEIIGEPGNHAMAIMGLDHSDENPFACTTQEIVIIRAIMAGSTKKDAAIAGGYTGKTPTGFCIQVLGRRQVQNEMKRLQAAQTNKIMYDPSKVIHSLVMIAEADPVQALVQPGRGKDKTVTLAQLRHMSPAERYAIKSLKFYANGTVLLEYYDKIAALKLLGLYFNLWGEKAPRTPPAEGGQVLEETIVFEKRMDEIGEVVHGRIDRRIIERFEGRGNPRADDGAVDRDTGRPAGPVRDGASED